jgi:hypothetical protein
VSRTTIIWAARITKRKTEGWLRRCRRVPGGRPEVWRSATGRVLLRDREGIDYFLPAGRIKAEGASVSIRRVLPFSKPFVFEV